MKIVDDLLVQHAALRRHLAELEALLGPRSDAGWDDCSNCDMAQFQARMKQFLAELKAHETSEERIMEDALRSLPTGQDEFRKGVLKSHETLDNLMKLLNAAAVIDHGRHVYSVRNITNRVHDELEAHLAYEEKTLFPLLEAKSRAHSE